MDRINSNYMATLSPGGRRGWQDVNPPTVPNGTQFNAQFMNAVQEEMLALIEGTGITPSATAQAQILQALRRLTGSNYVYLPASASPVTLTPDQCGRLVVNAASGSMTITLPVASAINGAVATVATNNSLEYEIFREDSSGNTVTLVCPSGDNFQFAGTGSASLQVPPLATAKLWSDTNATWLVTMPPPTTQAPVTMSWSTPGTYTQVIPPGVTSVRTTLAPGGAGGGGSKQSGDAGVGGAGGAEVTFILGATPGDTWTIVVGASGVGGAGGSSPAAGAQGGATSVTSAISGLIAEVIGGTGGAASNAAGIVTTGNTPGYATAGTPAVVKAADGGGFGVVITGSVILNGQPGGPWGDAAPITISSNGASSLRPGRGGFGGTNGGSGGNGAPGFAMLEY